MLKAIKIIHKCICSILNYDCYCTCTVKKTLYFTVNIPLETILFCVDQRVQMFKVLIFIFKGMRMKKTVWEITCLNTVYKKLNKKQLLEWDLKNENNVCFDIVKEVLVLKSTTYQIKEKTQCQNTKKCSK